MPRSCLFSPRPASAARSGRSWRRRATSRATGAAFTSWCPGSDAMHDDRTPVSQPPAQANPPVSYETRPAVVSVRGFRLLLALTLLNTALFASYVLGPGL